MKDIIMFVQRKAGFSTQALDLTIECFCRKILGSSNLFFNISIMNI